MTRLPGARCTSCGRLLFPAQTYGCDACGGPVEPADIPTEGTLHAFAVVHVHPTRATPFTVGQVELDAGPLVTAVLEGAPAIGSRVRGVTVDEELCFGA